MYGVRRLLYEIVYNLCDNAIKYNNPGGSVKISIIRKSDEVLLSVQDTGIGISPEHQDKIFERFYRVDKARSREAGGSGIGLAIVHDMVVKYGGTIAVAARKNGGTRFTITFPLYEEVAP